MTKFTFRKDRHARSRYFVLRNGVTVGLLTLDAPGQGSPGAWTIRRRDGVSLTWADTLKEAKARAARIDWRAHAGTEE